MFRKFVPVAVAAVTAFALSTASFAAPPANQQKGKSAMSEKTKKPGETCDNLSRTTAAYKDCIAKNAHDGKTPGAKGKGKAAAKPTG